MPGTAPDTRRSRAFRLAVRHYAGQFWRDRRWSITALVLTSLGAVLSWLCPALVVAAVLERYGDGGRPTVGELVPYLAAFGGVWSLGEVCWRLGNHFLNRAASTGPADLQAAGLDALLEKDLAFFADNFAGALTKKVVGYGHGYDMVLSTLAFQVAPHVLPLVFASIVLWGYSPWLVAVIVGVIGTTAAIIFPLIVRRQRIVDRREAAHNVVAGHVADTLTNMDAVRLFARERDEAAMHARNLDRWRRLALRSWDYQNRRIDLVTSPLYVGANVAGVALAVALAGDGAVSLGAVFITFTYYGRVMDVMFEFNQVYRNIETHLSAAAQFTELLLDPPTVTDPAEPDEPAFRDAGVEFRAVRFTHAGRTEPLFAGLDLRIAPGERVGLVGPSGGGKSTLTRLLLRVADIDAGTILLGGQDVARVRQADLRGQVAYVPQDPVMFHRSLHDNIAIGRPGAGDGEVRAAARAAHADEFISALPDGYATLVGERGIKLSGGQRQRLAIARAVLRRAPVLVLDEATSSLDSESERLIQEALLTVMEDRTAIVIAHRLSTVRAMDRLIVLDRGAVVEDGTHDELLAAGGTYAALWHTQSGGFLGADPDEPDAVLTGR